MEQKALFLIPPSKHAKNVARDLVYGCWCKGRRIAGIQFPPLSQVLAATVVRDSGVPVELIDAGALQMSVEDVVKKSNSYFAVVILTSNMTYNEDVVILSQIKTVNSKIISIVYGGFVTALPEAALLRSSVDIVVRREAEMVIKDLIKKIYHNQDWTKLKGISFRDKNIIKHNEDAGFIGNLDELPFPDRKLLPDGIDYFNPIVKKIPFTAMFSSRGCPGLCTFCSSPTFYGRNIRFRSAENVLAEMEEIVKLGYKEIFVRDEIFTVSRKRVFDICEGILKKGIEISWICSARIGSIDKEMMGIMKKAGCHMIRLGVESGVQELLDKVKKGIKVEKTIETFKWAKEIGLDTHAHMMIGLPGETKETIEKSIKFALTIEPTIVTFGIMTPYAGTPLFEELKNKFPEIGDTTQADLSRLHTESFFNESFTELSKEELSRYIRIAYKKFYFRPGYIFRWIKRIRSFDELKRVILAGTQVFEFSLDKKD